MKFSSIVFNFIVQIPCDKNFSEVKNWCDEHNSNYNYSSRAGHHRRVAVDPNTFLPIIDEMPHIFWFECEEDAAWFALRWS